MSDATAEQPKRSFWRIHLSTALLLMLLTGVLLLINRACLEDFFITFQPDYPERFRMGDRLQDAIVLSEILVADLVVAVMCEAFIRLREQPK